MNWFVKSTIYSFTTTLRFQASVFFKEWVKFQPGQSEAINFRLVLTKEGTE